MIDWRGLIYRFYENPEILLPVLFLVSLLILFLVPITRGPSYLVPHEPWGLLYALGLFAGLAFGLGLLPLWWILKKAFERFLSRAKRVLQKKEEVSYANLDSRNILDAFEKAPGSFYFSYREADESLLMEVKEGKIERHPESPSRIRESLANALSTRTVDARSGMTSFFVIRTEDELVDRTAFDYIITYVKRESPQMHSVKGQVIDVPIWRVSEKPEVSMREKWRFWRFKRREKVEEYKMDRKYGLLFTVSGVDVPGKIVDDVETAKKQVSILSNIESLRNLRGAEQRVKEHEEEEARKHCDKLAYWIKFKMDAGEGD